MNDNINSGLMAGALVLSRRAQNWARETGRDQDLDAAFRLREAYQQEHGGSTLGGRSIEALETLQAKHETRVARVEEELSFRRRTEVS